MIQGISQDDNPSPRDQTGKCYTSYKLIERENMVFDAMSGSGFSWIVGGHHGSASLVKPSWLRITRRVAHRLSVAERT